MLSSPSSSHPSTPSTNTFTVVDVGTIGECGVVVLRMGNSSKCIFVSNVVRNFHNVFMAIIRLCRTAGRNYSTVNPAKCRFPYNRLPNLTRFLWRIAPRMVSGNVRVVRFFLTKSSSKLPHLHDALMELENSSILLDLSEVIVFVSGIILEAGTGSLYILIYRYIHLSN